MSKSFGRPRIMSDQIVYPKRGWEPPPPLEGYKRDPKDKWRFIKIIPECKFRIRRISQKPCGACKISYICNQIECPLFKETVTTGICEKCEFR